MPEFREVRQNARTVIHRTYDGVIAGPVTTACGQEILHKARDPRVWQGHNAREFTECETCFAVPELDPDRDIEPGDLVTLTASTGLPSNPRGWTPESVYVYVGPTPHYANRAIVLVENGWLVRENSDRIPANAADADLATAQMRAWSVQTTGMAHAPADYDVDELVPRIRRARNRLIALRPAPTVPSSGQPTTESETQPVPVNTHSVGRDIYPLTYADLSTFPTGSVLTVRSRPRGSLTDGYVQFGCQSWPLARLAQAEATVEFTAGGVVVTADITTNGNFDEVTCAGNRISLGEFNQYAASVIVKEVAEVPVMNAFVMEHGFYGCAAHPGEVIFVGNGHPQNGEATAPMVGKVHPLSTETNRQTGTVGQVVGLRYHTFSDCTPVVSATNAVTMNLVRSRSYALVPATEQQVARMRAQSRYRCALAATTSDRVVACNSEGVPSAAPAMADASPF